MTEHQQQIDFQRGAQLALLRDVRLAGSVGHDGQRVSGMALKAALKAIDDYSRGGQCYASQTNLAAAGGMSRRVLQRAVARLIDLSLITCELRRNEFGRVTNHYQIVWNELSLLVSPPRNPSAINSSPSSPSIGLATEISSSTSTGAPDSIGQPAREARTAPETPPKLVATDAPPMRHLGRPMRHLGKAMRHHDAQSVKNRSETPIDAREPAADFVPHPDVESGPPLGRSGSSPPADPPSPAAISLFASAGFEPRDAQDLAREFALVPPDELTRIFTEYRAALAAKQLTGRGSVLFRLRRGRWPVDGIRTAAEIAAAAAAKDRAAAKRRQRQIETEIWHAIRYYRRQYGCNARCDHLIRLHLTARHLPIPPDLLESCVSGET